MRLHVTSKLRPHDIGNVQIGQNEIHIPGNSQSHPVSGECAERCTGLMLPRPIHLTDIYLHMHGLGNITLLVYTQICLGLFGHNAFCSPDVQFIYT